MYDVDKNVNKLRSILQREPTIEEIVDTMDTTKEKLNRMFSTRKVKNVRSLQETMEDGKSLLGEMIADDKSKMPIEAMIDIKTNEKIKSFLANVKLPYRAERILRLRYGFDGEAPLTLEQIGREFNVTRERIRQIEEKAIKKLKTKKQELKKLFPLN